MEEKIRRTFTPIKDRLVHIEKWQQSGLSMSAYSRKENISFSNLSKWIRSENKSKFKSASLTKIPKPIDSNYEIIVDNRIKIRLPNIFDISMIINIIKGLISCN